MGAQVVLQDCSLPEPGGAVLYCINNKLQLEPSDLHLHKPFLTSCTALSVHHLLE